jgi:chemotaxis protein MotB
MAKSWMKWALVASMAFMGVGCVAQGEHDRLLTVYRKSQEQVVDLQTRLEEANAQIAALREASATPPAELLAKLQQAEQERDAAQQALAEAESRMRELAAIQGPLPAELDQALSQLAAANPQIMTYDPKLGMIKFRSDLTFGLGSDVVQSPAVDTLQKLAQVIKSPAAAGYDVRIVGHTDNVRISNPLTLAKHPTNWHLSVHRAIAVKDVLEKSGVPATREYVAGYGPYRPIVANGPRGAEANRRVEIYLVRSTSSLAGAQPALPAAKAAAVPAPKAENPALFK